MNEKDFEKLHIGQEIYFGGEQGKISHLELCEGEYKIGFRSYSMSYIFTDIMDGLFFDKPKAKVKRAQYLYRSVGYKIPEITFRMFIDQEDFLKSIHSHESKFDFIIRLPDTEYEFEE